MKKPIPFGKYLLLERVNVGGMAEVFKAKAFGVEGFERLVALKRILPSIAEDQEFITMFIDEAKIAVQLTHANVAQIFDLGKVSESYFIAMEYVHGKDLRAIFDRVRKRGETVPVPMACYVIMKVCEGLDYAHNKKDAAGRQIHLVHRDVSPQNVLISYDGEVKLIDFGIAKAANKAGKTQAGILKGKFGYMSPEQVRGLPLDRRSDIFSVGIVLYELLTGERLFVGESDFSTLEKVRNVEIMPPSTYNRRIPEELEQIVLKALAKDVDDRYQTAMDLHDDLQSFMYTSGNFFARKDLSAYQRKSFADEIAKETARDEQYRKLDASAAASPSGLAAFDDIPGAAPSRAPAPPAANISKAPPPPPRRPKPTMMGMGAVAPPPPPARGSVPPPPPRPNAPSPRSTLQHAAPPAPAQPAAPSHPAPSHPAPSHPAPTAPALDMDWDDDELATQIYDKPEMGMFDAMAPAGHNAASAPSAPGAPSPFHPGAPASAAPAPAADGRPGAPSPFASTPAMPSAAPVPVPPEPTAVTRNQETKSNGPLKAIIGGGAILFIGLLVGGYFVLAKPDPGNVRFTTTPTDPVVLFDEHPVEATSSPFVISNVEPGRNHLLEVRKTGFRTYSTRFQLQPGQPLDLGVITLEAEGEAIAAAPAAPTPAVGTGLTLATRPAGAKVFVDGRELTETTPVELTDLSAGTHTIRVEASERYAPWQSQVEVQAGQIVAMPEVALPVRNAIVSFSSTPSGARVMLVQGRTRRNVGDTPVTADVDLTGRPWTVEMSLSGHADHTAEVSVPDGSAEHSVSATLEAEQIAIAPASRRNPVRRRNNRRPPAATMDPVSMTPTMTPMAMASSGGPGTLRINTRPWSQVFVDGRLIGNTPQMNISLPAGRHRVTLVNPDFNIRQSVSVNIQAGQVTTRIVTLNPG